MNEKKNAQVFHFDLYGKREEKYNFLNQESIESIQWKELEVNEPGFFFVKKDFEVYNIYKEGFEIVFLFKVYGMGITTGNDSQLISYKKKDLITLFGNEKQVKEIQYRIFDTRFIYYDPKKVERARESLMNHLLDKYNYGLLSLRGVRNNLTSKFGITNQIIDKSVVSTLDNCYVFPIYTYPESPANTILTQIPQRIPNLNLEIVSKIAENLGLQFTSEKDVSTSSTSNNSAFAPIDILDYIYAVLHSPTYREKYKEFLKIDFPRVPYPKDATTFWSLVALGGELRQIHLLESPKVNRFITTYPESGTNEVTKVKFEMQSSDNTKNQTCSPVHLFTHSQPAPSAFPPFRLSGKVYINDSQYFDGVPKVAWEFYIGGYQPAQKWLKDRKGRALSFEDILHYQKIIVALYETDRLMKEIDKVGIE
jgi:predicted helicase